MPADGKTFLAFDEVGDHIEIFPIQVSNGATSAGMVGALGPDGRYSPSMLPTSTEASDPIITTEALTAFQLVHIHDVAGERRIKKAVAADGTVRCHGFVKTGYQNGDVCEVYYRGDLVLPIGSFVAGDLNNSRVFLSATVAGGITKTPPNGPANLVQCIGFIREIDTTESQVTIVFNPDKNGVVRASVT